MTTKSWSSSKMCHLDLLFKVTELFIEYYLVNTISQEAILHMDASFLQWKMYDNKTMVKFEDRSP